MMYPPPPSRSDRSFTRVIFTTLAGTIFGVSLLLNLYALLWMGMRSGSVDSAAITPIVKGDKTQTIAVIPIEGVIFGETVEKIEKLLQRVEEDNNVKALVLEIDTPGGGVTASDQIHHRIQEFKQRRNIPVIASIQSQGTSGGYYIACAADYIYAQPTTLTGNIGVMMPRINLAGLAERWGIEDNSLHSTGADFKTAGSFLKEETPEEREYWLGLIDDSFQQFKDVIVAGRVDANGQTRLKAPINEIANGKAYTARQAHELGLIDAIGYLSDACAYVQSDLGLSNPHVVRYKHRQTLFDLFGTSFSVNPAQGSADGTQINVQVDRRIIEELFAPRPMYLLRVE